MGYGLAELNYIMLFFSATFAAVANADYIRKVLKGQFDKAGPSVAHFGFALVMLGALISTSGSDEVSKNRVGLDLRFLNEDFSSLETIEKRPLQVVRIRISPRTPKQVKNRNNTSQRLFYAQQVTLSFR